jgi:hypothetical protein
VAVTAPQRAASSRPRPAWLVLAAALAGPLVVACSLWAQEVATPALTREQQETFLREARIIRTRAAPGGVTGSLRVTLSDGVFTHDAHVQAVDEAKPTFRGERGVELNFRDTWRFNVAAYRLALLLGLDMVPATVERRSQQGPAAFTWWVDDVQMDEATRVKKKIRAPDTLAWNQQLYVVRVFDQLIYNVDRNLENLLITNEWRVWMIDHTRAFRLHRTLRTPGDLQGCDRALLARLEALDEPTLRRELSPWLERGAIDALLARRDVIVALFRQAPPDALFDLKRPQPF